MKIFQNKRGFTLIEMLIALSIFVLVMLLVVNVYFIINNTQRRVAALQKVQDDVRFLFEAMSQEIRLGQVDYSFYDTEHISLNPNNGGGSTTVLALQDQLGESLFFRLDGTGTKVQYCKIDSTQGIDCDLTDDSQWNDFTPAGVEIRNLEFIITPSADSFTDVGEAVDCSTNGQTDCDAAGLYSYRCDGGVSDTCLYYSDSENFQPKVQIRLTAEALDSLITEESRTINLQTIVSSRIFQGKVKNFNYE